MDWLPTLSDGSGPIYQQISDAIERDISNGALRRGQQMPTHRALAAALRIDLTTVTRAYSDARHRGLLDARVGQGTFVSESTQRASLDLPPGVRVDLSMNIPPQPVEAALDMRIERGIASLHKRYGLSSLLNYQEPGGTRPDRLVAGAWLEPRLPTVSAERIVICPGSQAAIFNILLTRLKPRDVVLTEELTFPGFKVAADSLGIRLVGVSMDEQGVVPEALEKALAVSRPKAVYLTPTMHNPTTATMSKARRKEVAGVLEKSTAFLIEDDAYGALDPAQQLLAGLIPDKTFVTASLSKCLTPALRVSVLVTPDGLAAADVRRSLRATTQMAAPLMCALVIEWFRSGEARDMITAIRNEATGRQQLARRTLQGLPFSAHPNGHHLWLPLPDRWSKADIVVELFRQNVAVVGSEAFAVDPTTRRHAVRLGLGAARNRAELCAGLELLVATLRREAASVV